MAVTCDVCGKPLGDDNYRVLACLAKGPEQPEDWTRMSIFCIACWLNRVPLRPVKAALATRRLVTS